MIQPVMDVVQTVVSAHLIFPNLEHTRFALLAAYLLMRLYLCKIRSISGMLSSLRRFPMPKLKILPEIQFFIVCEFFKYFESRQMSG